MIPQDFILFIQETASCFSGKQHEQCLLNPPCGCANPGKDLQCESCPHLEASLSHLKTRRASASKSNSFNKLSF
ncbi:MAG TPA: hypothetical protein V6D12_16715 [Candidatus Obscuribacterales bacterium]